MGTQHSSELVLKKAHQIGSSTARVVLDQGPPGGRFPRAQENEPRSLLPTEV